MRRHVKLVTLVGTAVVLCAAAAIAVFWRVDIAGADGRPQRNVTVAGIDVGRRSPEEVRAVVEAAARRFAERPVTVEAGGRTLATTAGELGLAVDVGATTATVLGRSDGSSLGGLGAWIGSFVGDRHVQPVLDLDRTVLDAALVRLDTDPTAEPVEPTVRLSAGAFVPVEGRAGSRIDADAVAVGLSGVTFGDEPVAVTAALVPRPPKAGDGTAVAAAGRLNALTASPLPVRAGTVDVLLDPGALRSAITPDLRAADPATGAPTIDGAKLTAAITPLVPDPVAEPTAPAVTVVDGMPTVVPGVPGGRCCEPAVVAATVADALVQRIEGSLAIPVEIPLIPIDAPAPPDLAALGIVEQIGTFTTPHKCCEGRVTNIHRAADVLRGTVVDPGAVLSLNRVLGERSAAKGYVAAPAIINGVLKPQIGGGVSQIATTLFNAAFFAGLDLVEYQSHSIYIGRYPYGREATVFYPELDLKVRNTTGHSILVWTEYTDTSITVTLYGTRAWASVEQGGQSRSPSGVCTSVRTERVRTGFDGTAVVDSVKARYRPAEGVNCDGSLTTPPPE